MMPRRNPPRKSRAATDGADYRPITRSMTKEANGEGDLLEGMEDEQELRRVAIRSRCVRVCVFVSERILIGT